MNKNTREGWNIVLLLVGLCGNTCGQSFHLDKCWNRWVDHVTWNTFKCQNKVVASSSDSTHQGLVWYGRIFTLFPHCCWVIFHISYLGLKCTNFCLLFALKGFVFCLLWFFSSFVWVWLTGVSPPFTCTPALDHRAGTYLHTSRPCSPVRSKKKKVPAFPEFSDLGEVVRRINMMNATCAQQKPVSVSKSAQHLKHEPSQLCILLLKCVCVWECVSALKNKCMWSTCLHASFAARPSVTWSKWFLDPSAELTAALFCVVTALINLIMMTYRWGFMLR